MNEEEEDDNKPSFEELKRRKAELENEIPELLDKIQESQSLKAKLLEAKKDSKKLIHHREKLKSLKSEHLGSFVNMQSKEKKVGDESQVNGVEKLLLPGTTGKEDNEEHNAIIAPLKREIHALKIENSLLVREKRKVEEQKDDLVQELAALNTKHDKLLAVCNRLEEEIHRLSSCVGKSQSESSDQKEDIEVLKQQLRLFQDDIKSFQDELQFSQRTNERLKLELNEARSVIRDMRGQPPRVQVYPAAIYEPVHNCKRYDEYGYRHTREPLGYTMMRSYSGECLVPLHNENRRSRIPYKRSFLTPDLTAEVDNEVVDRSLASPKSI